MYITFEIYDTSCLKLLVNNLASEQLVEQLPIYQSFYGEAVTKAYINIDGKRTMLYEGDMERLNDFAECKREIANAKQMYRVYKRLGWTREMENTAKAIKYNAEWFNEEWTHFVEWHSIICK